MSVHLRHEAGLFKLTDPKAILAGQGMSPFGCS